MLYWAPRFVHSLWKAKEIHPTENGCAADDKLADGVPVKDYFLWSMMDKLSASYFRGVARRNAVG